MEVKLQNLLNWQIYQSCWEKERFLAHVRLAEEVGFEPTDEDHSSTVFKTAAFNRSATLPKENWIIRNFPKLANYEKKEWQPRHTTSTVFQVTHFINPSCIESEPESSFLNSEH